MSKKYKITIAILLSVYLLFTTGIIYKYTSYNVIDTLDIPFSYALSGEETGLISIPTQNDIACCKWLAGKELPVCAGYNTRRLLAAYVCKERLYLWNPLRTITPAEADCYIFYTEWETRHGATVDASSVGLRKLTPLKHDGYPVVYRKGDAIIYVTQK